MAQGDNILYEKDIPFEIIKSTNEIRKCNLRSQISISSPTKKEHIIHLQLTEEEDPFFFHSLDINEEDFHTLKNEQEIKVDFSSFPNHLMEFMDRCLLCSQKLEEQPRWKCLLDIQTMKVTLKVIEENKFRDNIRLSLFLCPGNDPTIKFYLANRLLYLKNTNRDILTKLTEYKSQLGTINTSYNAIQEKMNRIQQDNQQDLAQIKLSHASEINQLVQQGENQRKEIQEKSSQDMKELRRQLDLLSEQNQHLSSTNITLSQQLQTSEGKLSHTTSEYQISNQNLNEIQNQRSELELKVLEQEKSISHQILKLTVLEQKIQDKNDICHQHLTIIDHLTQQKSQLESQIDQIQHQNQHLENQCQNAFQEINKGNSIIKELSNELSNTRQKIKLKNTVISQQEKIIDEKKTKTQQIQSQLNLLQKELEQKEQDNHHLLQSLQNAQKQIHSCEEQLDNTTNIIKMLQKQLTEKELEMLSRPPATSSLPYSFLPAPTTSLSQKELEMLNQPSSMPQTFLPTSSLENISSVNLPSSLSQKELEMLNQPLSFPQTYLPTSSLENISSVNLPSSLTGNESTQV